MKILFTLIFTYCALFAAEPKCEEISGSHFLVVYHQCEVGALFQRFYLSQSIQQAFKEVGLVPVHMHETSLPDNVTYCFTYIFPTLHANVRIFPDLRACSIEFFNFGFPVQLEKLDESMRQVLGTTMGELHVFHPCLDSRP